MDAVQRASAGAEGAAPAAAAQVLRTYGIGAQILRDLGVQPDARAVGAEADARPVGFDLEVVEYVAESHEVGANGQRPEHRRRPAARASCASPIVASRFNTPSSSGW